MSVDAITWAYRQDVKPSARKFILVTLSNWSDPIGYGWWPQDKIARRTGQEIRAVRNHLSALEEDGLIRRVARRDKKGRRDDDGFLLDPDNRFGLEEIIGARKPELIEGFRSKRHNVPVDTAEPTGTFGKSNRHVSQDLPAESAAIYKEETTLNTTPKTRSPDGDLSAPGRAAAPAHDFKSRIFGPALDWLAEQSGRPKNKLRSMVGRWCRDHGDGRTLEIMTQASRCGPVEPVAWIEVALKDEGNGKRHGGRDGLTAGQTRAAGLLGLEIG